MRLLHVVPTYIPAWRRGGPIRSVHGLARALVERGHEVTVFTTDVDCEGRVPTDRPVPLDGVAVRYFPVRFPRRLYHSPAMRRALQAEIGRFDVVHLHSVFLWPTLAAARAAERAGVPYVVSPRGMLVRELLQRRGRLRKTAWLRLFERRTLARAAALHATSELEAEELRCLGLTLPPIAVVPNGVETPEEAGDVPASVAGEPYFLFLGRLSWKKGLDRLVRALPGVPDASLAVAGPDEEGTRARIGYLAREAGSADRIVFLGEVHGGEKAALLRHAVALVLPSYSENFGNVVLEAMAAGRPVVVTPEVGLAEIVRREGAGLVVEGDPEPLAAALNQLLRAPRSADEMGQRGARAARRLFGWDTIARETEGLYDRIRRGGDAKLPSAGEGRHL